MSPAGRPRPKVLEVRALAKVNLGLEVLGLREDGYHELRTIFQTVDLGDDIRLRRTPGALSVHCDHPGVPGDERNLALRAAVELRRWAQVDAGAEIRIVKRIPVAGGLGGGSSDAAAVLRALDVLWGLRLGPPGLMPLARRLGADVPFFLVGGTALGLARGDEIYPLRRQVRAHCVIVAPGIEVKTPAVFARLDAGLVPRENCRSIFPFLVRDLEGGEPFSLLANDLEAAALEVAPELADTIHKARAVLLREGANLAILSGSGSSFFGLFPDARGARRARAALAAAGLPALTCRTVDLDQYRRRWSRSLGEFAPPGRTR